MSLALTAQCDLGAETSHRSLCLIDHSENSAGIRILNDCLYFMSRLEPNAGDGVRTGYTAYKYTAFIKLDST